MALKSGDADRYVLRGSRSPKKPTGIRQDLEAIGFPVEQFQSVLESIHTTLKRLVEAREVERVDVNGKTGYLATANMQSVRGLELYS